MMLARHAEELFWMGRYLERAEQTARVVDVTYHAALEAGSGRSSADIWGDLAEALSVDDEHLASDVEQTLILDRESTASIARIVANARENARSTREWLSVEVWESLNEVHLMMQRAARDTAGGQPYGLLRAVKSGCQTVSGAALASMPRSTGYRFYRAGVMLERALATSRAVTVWQRRLSTTDHRQSFAEWQKLLRTVSAQEAFLREHKATFEAVPVLCFLLQSDTFPRSVRYCLGVVEDELIQISDGNVGREARRSIGVLRAGVEFSDITTMEAEGLTHLLRWVEEGTASAAAQVEEDYFRVTRDEGPEDAVSAEPLVDA